MAKDSATRQMDKAIRKQQEKDAKKILKKNPLPDQIAHTISEVLNDAAVDATIHRLHDFDGHRCILFVQTADALKEDAKDYVTPLALGRMSDLHGYFFRVKFSVDYPQEKVRSSDHEVPQVWPCNMHFKIDLQYGQKELVDGKRPVDTTSPSWLLKIPAKNHSQANEVELPIMGMPPSIVRIKQEGSHHASVPEIELDAYLKACRNNGERELLRELREKENLYFMKFPVYGRMLAFANTFKRPAESPSLQHVVDWLQKLHSEEVKDTLLSFSLFLYAPKDENSDFGAIELQRAFENFQKAQKLENRDEDYFYKLYGKTAGLARISQKNGLKEPQELPNFRLKLPLVYNDIPTMYLARGLDLHMQSYLQRDALWKIEMADLRMHTLILGSGEDGTFGGLVETSMGLPATTLLNPGAVGTLRFNKRLDMKEWSFVVGQLPGIGRTTDMFLTIRPIVEKDENGVSFIPTARPYHMIDVEAAIKAGTLQERLAAIGASEVRLKITDTNTTEKQQYKALQLANPETSRPERFLSSSDPERRTPEFASKVSEDVTKLLSGQGLQQLGRASIYSPGFIKDIKANMDHYNKLFANAIGVPGATLSAKQIEFALDYPDKAPADKKLLCNGMAGTSKSTVAGVTSSFLHLDNRHPDTGAIIPKHGLLVAEMHSTVNTSLATMEPIVLAFTGKHCVREYGHTVDFWISVWFYNGCPDEHWMPVDSINPSELAEVNDVILSLKNSVKKYAGNRTKRFLGYEQTAVWIVSKELGLIQPGDGRPKFQKTKLSAGITTEASTIPNEDELDKEMVDVAALDQYYADDPDEENHSDSCHSSDFDEFGLGHKRVIRDTMPQQVSKRLKENKNDKGSNIGKTMHSKEQVTSYYSSSEAVKWPEGSWQQDLFALRSLLKVLFEQGFEKSGINQGIDFIRKFKEKWYHENVAVVGTTISMVDSKEIMAWNPTHLIGDEWQSVSDANSLVVFTAHHDIPMYLIGDIHQPSPYMDDQRENPFHAVRSRSWFENEILRGRDHVVLNQSRRTDSIGVQMSSDLFYEGLLTSDAPEHPQSKKIAMFNKKHFGTHYRHTFINTDSGEEQKVGFRQSSINQGVMAYVIKLVHLLLEDGFAPDDIAILAPYKMEEDAYNKIFRELAFADKKVPLVISTGSIMAMMGDQAKIVIVSIPKTETMGFLNTKGFWCVDGTRSELATYFVCNYSRLRTSKARKDNLRQFLPIDRIAEYLMYAKGYKKWDLAKIPIDGAVSETLYASLVRHQELQEDFNQKQAFDIAEAAAREEQQEMNSADQAREEDQINRMDDASGRIVNTSTWNTVPLEHHDDWNLAGQSEKDATAPTAQDTDAWAPQDNAAWTPRDNTTNDVSMELDDVEVGPSSGLAVVAAPREFDTTNWEKEAQEVSEIQTWTAELTMSNTSGNGNDAEAEQTYGGKGKSKAVA